jgi:signal transduction histidine kinase
MADASKNNPVSDVLEHGSFAALAKVLRERSGTIVEKWEDLVRETLPRADALTLAQVRDEIPRTLSMLADALESTRPGQAHDLNVQSGAHGTDRFSQGYNVEELLVEYRLLRRVVLDEVESHLGRRTTKNEDMALSMGIDAVLSQGVVAFFRHLEAELGAAAEAESKFLAYLSHDLRNQLNHILLVLQLLTVKLRGNADTADEMTEIGNVRQAIHQTVEGMERLLKSARLRSGHAEAKLGMVNLDELLHGLTVPFVREAGVKGIGVETRVPPGATCVTDRRLLMVILHNLLSNAVKYSDKGTISVSAVQRPDGKWELTVADQGLGMSREFRERMFGEFVRGEAHGRPGMGLGLAIVARAVNLLEAEMTVDSEPGAGTRFQITCPCKSLPEGVNPPPT